MNLIKKYIFLLFLLFPSLCFSKTENVIYVNGIQNTFAGHEETLDIIKAILSKSENHSDPLKKIDFKVSGIWNPIGFAADLNSLGFVEGGDLEQDLKELFLLKTAEENFANDFQKIIAPHNTSSSVDKEAATRILAYLDDITPGNNSLETVAPIVTDVDMQPTKNAIIALYARIKFLDSAVVVAHSQGNLLANLAYAKLVSEYGNDIRKKVMVVNIANTSEFSANNLNISHAGDRALFKDSGYAIPKDLTTLPSQKNWLRTTPRCSNTICDFSLTAPTLGAVAIDITDDKTRLQHSIVTTYLSNYVVNNILDSQYVLLSNLSQLRFVDLFEDFVYTAANAVNKDLSLQRPLPSPSFTLGFSKSNLEAIGASFERVEFIEGMNFRPAVKFAPIYHAGDISGFIKIPNRQELIFDANEATFDVWLRLDSNIGMVGVDYGFMNSLGWKMAILAKPDNVNGFAWVLESNAIGWPGSGYGYHGIDTKDSSFNFGTNGSIIARNVGIPLNQWFRATSTISQTEGMKFYVNKSLIASYPSAKPSFAQANIQDMYLGRFNNYWYPFAGAMQDLRIYKTALTEAEVQVLP